MPSSHSYDGFSQGDAETALLAEGVEACLLHVGGRPVFAQFETERLGELLFGDGRAVWHDVVWYLVAGGHQVNRCAGIYAWTRVVRS